jgi:hypothetical protein
MCHACRVEKDVQRGKYAVPLRLRLTICVFRLQLVLVGDFPQVMPSALQTEPRGGRSLHKAQFSPAHPLHNSRSAGWRTGKPANLAPESRRTCHHPSKRLSHPRVFLSWALRDTEKTNGSAFLLAIGCISATEGASRVPQQGGRHDSRKIAYKDELKAKHTNGQTQQEWKAL